MQIQRLRVAKPFALEHRQGPGSFIQRWPEAPLPRASLPQRASVRTCTTACTHPPQTLWHSQTVPHSLFLVFLVVWITHGDTRRALRTTNDGAEWALDLGGVEHLGEGRELLRNQQAGDAGHAAFHPDCVCRNGTARGDRPTRGGGRGAGVIHTTQQSLRRIIRCTPRTKHARVARPMLGERWHWQTSKT